MLTTDSKGSTTLSNFGCKVVGGAGICCFLLFLILFMKGDSTEEEDQADDTVSLFFKF